mmetsp:Transcript_45102/g.72088  ORF Transcript_45102/g.72088 Transcript_45102/m.72088 type:complete len:216 (+) Transcript_45102:340-987(+)
MERSSTGGQVTERHAEITKDQIVQVEKFRWIALKRIEYNDEGGKERVWEAATRTTRKAEVDAVFIVATLVSKDKEPQILLVSQFRPPTEAYCLEFPAGLVDEGENAEEAAIRELREETGYFGEVKSISPALFIDPGMSNANLQFVSVVIDTEMPLNKFPKQRLDEGENISTHCIPRSEFMEYIKHPNRIAGLETKKVVVSGLLYSFCLGNMVFSS